MRFYKLFASEGKKKKYAWAFPPFESDDKLIQCDVCGRMWYNSAEGIEKNISYPITFTNNHFPDFMSCQGIDLVSQYMKETIEKNGIKVAKFSEMPVIGKSEFTKEQLKELRDDGYDVNKLHDEKPKYYRFNSNIGATLHSDSNVIWVDFGENICKHCGYGVGYKQKDYFAPEYIQLDSWNGNELFKVREFAGALYCTETFKELCEKSEFTGMEFEEVEAR